MLRVTARRLAHNLKSRSQDVLSRSQPWQPLVAACRCLSSQGAEPSAGSASPSSLPAQARVVICGGGLAGLSVAYSLTKLGWCDVVLLEQGKLTGGSTWSASGIMGILRKSHFSTRLAKMSYDLYQQVEKETGIQTGLNRCGSVYVGQTKDLMSVLRRRHATSKMWEINSELLTPRQIQQLLPWLRIDDLEGGLLVADDACARAKDIASALATATTQAGVRIIEHIGVDRIEVTDGRVTSVHTTNGPIQCENFINCAGLWARDLGQVSSPAVRVPLYAAAQQYLITKPLSSMALTGNGPYVRDTDSLLYVQEHQGGFLFGGYAPTGRPVFDDSPPQRNKTDFIQLPDDWDHFRHLLEGFLHRVPTASDIQFERLLNAPESFTPDGELIMGEAAEVRNYYVLAGFNSLGVTYAGGASQLLAELIVDGHCSADYWTVDIKRFCPQHNSKAFLRSRMKEVQSLNYRVPYPSYSFRRGRKLRCPPLYSRLDQDGAVFGECLAAERPKWYMNPDDTDEFAQETQRGSFSKPQWFSLVESEYWACRKNVCLMDMSAFTKLELTSEGNEATMLLQRLCPNDLDCPIGSVVHTGMLNEQGGYESDCSIARFDTNRYFIICPTILLVKGYSWISRHLPADGSVTLRDLTSEYAGLNVLGPRARDVLQKLTRTSLTWADFKPFTCQEMNVGFATGVKAMTITHAGEDGMVLYIPNECAVQVYDALKEAGKEFGIRNAGYYALRWLRIEKFYFYWGEDFGSTTTPYEIGREMRVNFDKGVEFIGKSALLKQREEGVCRRLAGFILDDLSIGKELWPWSREPIYRNGQLAGMTTCSSYGPTLAKMTCLGWLTNPDPQTGRLREVTPDYVHKAQYEIDIAGKRYPAKARLYPMQLGTKQPTHG